LFDTFQDIVRGNRLWSDRDAIQRPENIEPIFALLNGKILSGSSDKDLQSFYQAGQ